MRRLRPADQVLLVLFWRSCRAAGLHTQLDGILGVAQQWNTLMVPMLRAWEDLSWEIPSAAGLFSPQQMRRALRSKRVMAQTHQAIAALRQEHSTELDAFFARRPEVQAAMDAYEASQRAAAQEKAEGQVAQATIE